MAFTPKDVISLSQARANLSELIDEVQKGTDKIITKNGEASVALISTEKLEHYYRAERARIHLLLLEDAKEAIAAWKAGEPTEDAGEAIGRIRARLRQEREERERRAREDGGEDAK
ncbi:type II toxin-antitoxin system Phd/YefM family antitoxin [Caballeronia sp. LP006]|jgi:prevent-host-death family protein|uniref:type II toxin-antitoxin system Phd/YefM family antitoxin n=1 Tax=unclassified Caballeronia TaxID=2646786 RepID=UPI002027A972|nr:MULTISPECIES: type II toxin-antitoxin system Phd/YefM family antitoxin [unclassified Caballeronia]MDR5770950.1 type II toxin-antitoxin system Phd/YefM family antitoxin [Caballeronia sp. LZ002]MDR5830681.1 type II toxin-antitoxin system Phd/YefM family antitoxin [Caballeronia sp. LP006]MDR5846387.1 type II toxin-antitoxin system Phd/YefM family antitoxin [Caballeronia sp. LZ003]